MTATPIQFTPSAPVGLPRLVPQQKWRPAKKNIPPTVVLRQHILHAVREYVAEHKPVPPLPAPYDASAPVCRPQAPLMMCHPLPAVLPLRPCTARRRGS